jgi:integrase
MRRPVVVGPGDRPEAGRRRGGVRKEERWTGFRSELASEIVAFIAAKRAFGRKYMTDERMLRLFDAYLAERDVARPDDVTPAMIDAFLASRRTGPRYFNSLRAIVHRLMRWLVAQGRLKRCDLTGRRRPVLDPRIPFIFDPALARRLLGMAADLDDYGWARRRGMTYKTLFALFYGLGLRASEGCRLQCGDVDLDRCLLTIRAGKFGKTRLVPFGSKVGGLLREQLEYRRPQGRRLDPSAPLFTFDGRRCIDSGGVSMTFLALVRRMQLDIPDGMAAPRMHDLRHSFAVGTLLRWYRQGINAGERLHYLSTFMGHADPASTVVYLTITDDLLKEANRRFESFAQPGATP